MYCGLFSLSTWQDLGLPQKHNSVSMRMFLERSNWSEKIHLKDRCLCSKGWGPWLNRKEKGNFILKLLALWFPCHNRLCILKLRATINLSFLKLLLSGTLSNTQENTDTYYMHNVTLSMWHCDKYNDICVKNILKNIKTGWTTHTQKKTYNGIRTIYNLMTN